MLNQTLNDMRRNYTNTITNSKLFRVNNCDTIDEIDNGRNISKTLKYFSGYSSI